MCGISSESEVLREREENTREKEREREKECRKLLNKRKIFGYFLFIKFLVNYLWLYFEKNCLNCKQIELEIFFKAIFIIYKLFVVKYFFMYLYKHLFLSCIKITFFHFMNNTKYYLLYSKSSHFLFYILFSYVNKNIIK